ncbi:hypothetical protein ACO22_01919 [Paracoccidioides brasiliensis]|uniref:Uncharacterized protein n=1 Tax=Paracoccidioides brasiliensis TaxID=121759 RepID=A0A1D2JKC6_PARBR|nr:hypothetical protein ACO22_01919 [Paracoccidioides brasiliensis]
MRRCPGDLHLGHGGKGSEGPSAYRTATNNPSSPGRRKSGVYSFLRSTLTTYKRMEPWTLESPGEKQRADQRSPAGGGPGES